MKSKHSAIATQALRRMRKIKALQLASDAEARVATLLSFEQLNSALYRSCAINLRPSVRPFAKRRDFYIATFATGLLKVGISERATRRIKDLPREALERGLDPGGEAGVCVVVPRAGRALERELLKALKPERVSGEWFQGPLSSAVAAALVVS